jgi:hypothetical protein
MAGDNRETGFSGISFRRNRKPANTKKRLPGLGPGSRTFEMLMHPCDFSQVFTV